MKLKTEKGINETANRLPFTAGEDDISLLLPKIQTSKIIQKKNGDPF